MWVYLFTLSGAPEIHAVVPHPKHTFPKTHRKDLWGRWCECRTPCHNPPEEIEDLWASKTRYGVCPETCYLWCLAFRSQTSHRVQRRSTVSFLRLLCSQHWRLPRATCLLLKSLVEFSNETMWSWLSSVGRLLLIQCFVYLSVSGNTYMYIYFFISVCIFFIVISFICLLSCWLLFSVWITDLCLFLFFILKTYLQIFGFLNVYFGGCLRSWSGWEESRLRGKWVRQYF